MSFGDFQHDAWHGGQLLCFSGLDGLTDFRNGLVARTAFGTPGIEIRLPGFARIVFANATGKNVVCGDRFAVGETRGAFIDAHHLLIEGDCDVHEIEPALKHLKSGNRTLIGAASRFDPAKISADLQSVIAQRETRLRNLRIPSNVNDVRRQTLLKALCVMKGQVCSPEGIIKHRWTTPDRWPHRRMWLWDSAFHAIGWRHVDAGVARDAISAMLDAQRPDGFIPHMADPDSVSKVTQPPILALGAKLVDEMSHDPGWIEEIYPKLCAYVKWDLTNRDKDGSGLVEWQIEGDPSCRCGESGMDNSPRFDDATLMDAVDFNSFLALECETLSKFARRIGRADVAAKWGDKHTELCSLIRQYLWSDKRRFFVDYDIEKHAQSPVLASSGFLPLICGAATEQQARILAERLADQKMFGTAFPVPSVAACDSGHYSKDMWRGPVWISYNWLIAFGFDRYGMHEVANALRERTMREIERLCEKYGVFFEFYDDRCEVDPPALLRKGKCEPPFNQVIHDFGWTATLYADMAFQSSKIARGH